MKACFISLGCVKNLVDSECILGLLKEGKIEIIDDVKESDIIFINTCGFITSAKKESIDTIFSVINEKKDDAYLIVCGCLAKRYKEELEKEIPEIDLIVGVDEYDTLGEKLNELLNLNVSKTFNPLKRSLSNPLPVAYLKIGEGCSNRCAYCAIPLIRGNFVSFKKEDIIEDAKRLIKLGKKEIIVIAQDPTRYGKDLYKDYFLEELMEDLLKLDDSVYFRVLYLYPDRISFRFVDLFNKYSNFIPYFDIPIQHSSNKMLALMGRSGTREKYLEVVNYIKKTIEKPILRTTLIVGFPQESEEDFKDLVDFVKEVKFDHLGVFTYSKEENTPAYSYKGTVNSKTAYLRRKEIMEIQQNISLELNRKRIKEVTQVLIEDFDGKNYYGRNYVFAPDAEDGQVIIKSKKPLIIGQFYFVEITGCTNYDLIGKIKEQVA